jgi:hypothetical protein
MNFVLTINLLTIPKVWSVSREFLTKAAIRFFSYFHFFSHFFTQGSAVLQYPPDFNVQGFRLKCPKWFLTIVLRVNRVEFHLGHKSQIFP